MDQNEKKLPTTHAVSTPNAKPPTQMETFKRAWHATNQKQLENYLASPKDALRFSSSVFDTINKTPKLLECSLESVFSAFITCAQLKLFPSNAGGEAYVLPYGKEAQFQLGYQGLITLLYRTGIVENITSSIIRSKDIFEYEEGLEPKLVHKPNVMSSDRGEAIGCYAIATLKGGHKQFKVMNKDEILKIKDMSKAKNSDFSPWNKNDPELWMWKKTVIKQLAKMLSKNEDVMKALEEDNKDSIVSNQLNASGPATGKASHAPTIIPVNELGNE